MCPFLKLSTETCIYCSVALIGNAFVVIWRLKTDNKKASSFFVINLGCSDFLMGVYMIIIAAVDVPYRGK